MDKVACRQFYIMVQIVLGGSREGRLWPVKERDAGCEYWVAIKEFGSENEAYDYGLQHCRAWIDQHTR